MKPLNIEFTREQLNVQSRHYSTGFQLAPVFYLREFKRPGMEDFMLPSAEGEVFWNLLLLGPDGTSPEITNQISEFKGITIVERTASGARIELRWNIRIGKDSDAEVWVSGQFEADSPLTFWKIRVHLPPAWKVVRADFPIVPNIAAGAGIQLAAPLGWGVEYDVAAGLNYDARYPSYMAAMQFLAFYKSGAGLYFATHDPKAYMKDFKVTADSRAARVALSTYAEISEPGGGFYETPFEAVLGAFDGGYYEAAQIYREFSLQTPWGRDSHLSRRRVPEWLRNTDLWLRPDGSAVDNVDAAKQAVEYFGVPAAMHWYRWHAIPYDTDYPNYLPAKPGFAEGVRAMQECGAPVMPYINGRLWDPSSENWKSENAAASAARDENGRCYTEIYGSRVPNNVMCPTTPLWREKVKSLVRDLIREYNVDGVYIDQIGCAKAERCYNPAHGHPLGGGHYWHDAYRVMLEEIRANLPADKMLTTEENAECWIDLFDALLPVNTPADLRVIPLFPAVYSGRAITFGYLYYPKDEPVRGLPFRFKNAQAFIFGAQLGWIQPWRIMAKGAEPQAEFLRTLARARGHAHEFVVAGRLLGLVETGGDNPEILIQGSGAFSGSYEMKKPSVIGSAWRSEDENAVGILLTNYTESERAIVIENKFGGAARKIDVFAPDGLEKSMSADSPTLSLVMPPLSARVLKIKTR